MQVKPTEGAVFRAALLELSNLPRAPRRHIRVARKLLAKAEALEQKFLSNQFGSFSDKEVVELESEAAHHLVCAGVDVGAIKTILILIVK